MGPALARENGDLGVFTLHAFNELLSYKAHIPTLTATSPFGALPGPSY